MSNMIVEPEKYFKQFIPERSSTLLELEAEAAMEKIPIVGPVVGQLLYIMAVGTRALSILELGTATGYSGVWLAKACEITGGRLLTIENNIEMAKRAASNFRKAGIENIVEIRTGDARELLCSIKDSVDLIFLDIEKEFYIDVLGECERLLRAGGLLVADNVGFKDADSFNHAIFSSPGWNAVHLLSFLPFHSPENDGLCIALRI